MEPVILFNGSGEDHGRDLPLDLEVVIDYHRHVIVRKDRSANHLRRRTMGGTVLPDRRPEDRLVEVSDAAALRKITAGMVNDHDPPVLGQETANPLPRIDAGVEIGNDDRMPENLTDRSRWRSPLPHVTKTMALAAAASGGRARWRPLPTSQWTCANCSKTSGR